MKITHYDERLDEIERRTIEQGEKVSLLEEKNSRGKKVNEALREKYPLSEEFAVLRKEIAHLEKEAGIEPTEEFKAYFDFAEKCKE